MIYFFVILTFNLGNINKILETWFFIIINFIKKN